MFSFGDFFTTTTQTGDSLAQGSAIERASSFPEVGSFWEDLNQATRRDSDGGLPSISTVFDRLFGGEQPADGGVQSGAKSDSNATASGDGYTAGKELVVAGIIAALVGVAIFYKKG